MSEEITFLWLTSTKSFWLYFHPSYTIYLVSEQSVIFLPLLSWGIQALHWLGSHLTGGTSWNHERAPWGWFNQRPIYLLGRKTSNLVFSFTRIFRINLFLMSSNTFFLITNKFIIFLFKIQICYVAIKFGLHCFLFLFISY